MTPAGPLGLAQFIAVVQDGLQRSYDFIEDVAEGGREGRPQGVLLTVSEVALSLPVDWSLRPAAVDMRPIEAATTTAYELDRLLLDMPMADPELRKTIREEAYSAISRQRFRGLPVQPSGTVEVGRRDAEVSKRRDEAEKQDATPVSRPTLDIRFSDEVREVVKRLSKREAREPEIALSVIGEESVRTQTGAAGRLELRFKPVLG
jgi:hypothetical protein